MAANGVNEKLYVLDTSVLIHDPEAIRAFRDTSVAIPIFVVMELDDLKVSARHEVASAARTASRRIARIVAQGDVNNPNGIADAKTGSVFYVVGQDEHFESLQNTTLSRKMDLLILGSALKLQERFAGKSVSLVSKDVNLRILAAAKGVGAEDYRKDRVDPNEVPSGVHERVLADPDALQPLYGLDPPDTVPGADLDGVSPNEFIRFTGDGVGPQLFRWNGSTLRPASRGKGMKFEARNDGQRMALDLLMDPKVHLVVLLGAAGSGKTLLSLMAGMHQLERHYDRIILSKPVVSMGRDLGYLPGSEAEKLHPWMLSFYDNLDQLLTTDAKDNKRKGVKEKNWEHLVQSGQVEVQPMHSIRGRSIPRSFMLIDECFPRKQRIATSCGNKTISWLYNQWRLGRDVPAVLSFNESSGQWEHKKITHAWKRAPRDLMMFRCANQKVRVTPNHRFFGVNGWVAAGDLKVGDLLRTTVPERHQIISALNDDQRQVVLGSFLGDGHIAKCGLNRYRMSEPHGIHQSDYCSWKASMFGVGVTVAPPSYGSTPLTRFATKVFGWEAEFPEKKTHCPQWVLDAIDARALAVWYMDDGSVIRARGKDCGAILYTCSFDEESHDRMVDTLRERFNVDCSHKLDNYGGGRTYRVIRMSAEGFRTLRSIISPYVHPNMAYKLGGASEGTSYNWDSTPLPYGLTVVDEIQRDAGHEPVYDLEVEDNHNFVACSGSRGVRNTGSTGILAHNCQNATPHEVKTVVSRAATGTKVVLCGDPSQIDDPFLDAFSNGLVHAAKMTRESSLAGSVYLGEGVRSPLAELAAKSL